MQKIATYFIFFLITQLLYGQSIPLKSCNQDKITEILRKIVPNYDTETKLIYDEWEQKQQDNNNARINALDTTYTIQTVIHIVYLEDNLEQNIPDDIIQSQIDRLNKDFGVLNEDTANLRLIFKNFRGYPKIKFELATNDPNGNPTNGVVKVAGRGPSKKPTFTNPIDSILFELTNTIGDWFKKGFSIVNLPNNVKDTTIGSPIWDNSKYLNIWVTDLNLFSLPTEGTLGGFAFAPPGLSNWPFGIGYPADAVDGVSIDYRFFGENNYFARNRPSIAEFIGKGRTTVHEVGHYLGLRHIWGDYGNVFNLPCNAFTHDIFFSDGMDDTPPCKAPFSSQLGEYRCDTATNSCNLPYQGIDYPDLFENYMDYSGDACYNMFTKKQADFLRFVLTTRRSGIISKRETEIISSTKNIKNTANQFNVYPNPAQDILHIEATKNQNTNIDIYTIDGKLIQQNHMDTNSSLKSINIQDFKNGTYVIKLYNADFVSFEKFIKQ
ncbi:MAG: T9SS type A sorting domain-containing protein [Sphingobacteriales bacterium]|jgi:hypothetical protein|nr:MAG: T9SS type A sorting domain-containing protein [Sphingobacteriales bacterium]